MPLPPAALTQCTEYLKAELPSLEALYLFGSQATGETGDASDVDLAILLPHPLDAASRWALTGELADILDRDVDLIDLRQASTILQQQVVAEGQRLWSRSLDVEEFELTVQSEYWDLAIQRRDLIADIKQRGRVHGR
ncbi:nucleotidyltransferase domain-containing protein [Halomonas sp. NO4]|uniref:type VII toxin-antitoxin system MntA family adenylyltransferase antitoxin n=1 Tax=Halomonas sp. NO4 TaxID=2484813 RepID=UPI0013D52563|nr:nucleotidyltransferase domain-containing protein [Halomonas sp. NO4]